MITSLDEDYKATKQIMLGKATMKPDFRKKDYKWQLSII